MQFILIEITHFKNCLYIFLITRNLGNLFYLAKFSVTKL